MLFDLQRKLEDWWASISVTTIVILALLVFTAFLWGATWPIGKTITNSMPTFSLAFGRFSIALPVMLLYVLSRKEDRESLSNLRRRDLPVMIGLGATGIFGYNFFFLIGLRFIDASYASMVIAVTPALTVILAAIVLKEALSIRRGVGVVVAFIGTFFLVATNQQTNFTVLGTAMIGGAAIVWSMYAILGRIIMRRLTPAAATLVAVVFGHTLLFPFALFEIFWFHWVTADLLVWVGIAFLGVCATFLGFTFYYKGIQRLGAGRAAVFINLVPVFSSILSAIFLGEIITLLNIFGILMIIIGVTMATLTGHIPNSKKTELKEEEQHDLNMEKTP